MTAISGVAAADVVSDQAAAIVIWPDVTSVDLAQDDSWGVLETILQLSNTSDEAVLAHCFHENANTHCSNTGQVCIYPSDCCDGGNSGCGLCEPGWLETDFRVRLTPRQPLGWRAGEGKSGSEFPLTGATGSRGPDGSSNAGSNIPPVSEAIYNGALKCIAINDDGTPSDRNVLIGEATRVFQRRDGVSISKYNAVGIRAIAGAVNDDRELLVGGAEAEYEGCPEVLIVNHLFDGGSHPLLAEGGEIPSATQSGFGLAGPAAVATRLTLVPCTQDLLRQIPGSAVVQYLVYNEFEQRFSTSRGVDCKFERVLSTIDTTDPQRSIFSVGVAGSVAGQSRLRAIGSGLVGIATEGIFERDDDATVSGGLHAPGSKMLRENPSFGLVNLMRADLSDFNIHQQGDRSDADIITLP